jgi:predicted ATP-grasp superfamily ATP-dependent carboligase
MNKVSVRHSNFSPIGGGSGRALAVGVSARALVAALTDSNFRVISVDAFGDQDTQENAIQTIILPQWGTTISELSLQPEPETRRLAESSDTYLAQNYPVFWAGGTENWPEMVTYLAGHPKLRLLAPSEDQLKLLRSARLWAQVAQQAGLGFPESIDHLGPFGQVAHQSIKSRWLRKKVIGGGGFGVTISEQLPTIPQSSCEYFQQEICGTVMGVNFSVAWNRDSAGTGRDAMPEVTLMGIVQSWSSDQWPGPSEFIYRGSWGPIAISQSLQDRLSHLAQLLATETGITGWLQMDCIEDQHGQCWLLEVNPRWTAGMEVLLRSGVTNPAAHHAAAWGYPNPSSLLQVRQPNSLIGKAILYAPCKLLLTSQRVDQLQSLPRERFADIPSDQMKDRWLDEGSPILTVLASCDPQLSLPAARKVLLDQLQQSARQVAGFLMS